MPVPQQRIEEGLSISYATAVITRAGFTPNIIDKHYGVDLELRKIGNLNGSLMDMGALCEFQLKSTINWNEYENEIIYDLEAETFNKISHRNLNSAIPCILVLLCLPREENDWLHISDEEFKIKKCCYYYRIENGETTTNSSSIRIKIPKANIFSPSKLKSLVLELERAI